MGGLGLEHSLRYPHIFSILHWMARTVMYIYARMTKMHACKHAK